MPALMTSSYSAFSIPLKLQHVKAEYGADSISTRVDWLVMIAASWPFYQFPFGSDVNTPTRRSTVRRSMGHECFRIRNSQEGLRCPRTLFFLLFMQPVHPHQCESSTWSTEYSEDRAGPV